MQCLKVAAYSFRSVSRKVLSTREISSATRNTRGRRCTRGEYFEIASWYTRVSLRGIVGWSREEIEILIFVTSHR
jgi:hypothetical protein